MKLKYLLLGIGLLFGLSLLNPDVRQLIIGETTPVIDINKRHPNDKRQYRAITLKNQLTVLLISDPNLNKSAAALDVGVGSLEDPPEHLGLAHFLEHMLFLGTQKYPDIEEYSRYLNAHQGSSNAYTAAENTNYHFEVNHSGFEGALDRFAQFFIAPLFSPEYVDREMQAVHSEHQKNLNDDYWRTRMVLRSLHKKGHPRQKFSTGDLSTLKNVDRDTLITFYKKYYSANHMKLVLLSKYELDQLEEWARKMFSDIPNNKRDKLVYEPTIFDDEALPRLIQIEPVKNLKKLILQFAAPSKDNYWRTKPGSTISHLVGHEGKGSLLSLLKKEGLATGLSAWLESSSYAGIFQFEINLTDEGAKKRDQVIEYFFSYINMLRQQGYKKYIYDERKTMADVNYVYRDLKEGMHVVTAYASRMHQHDPLEIDKNEALLHEYSKKDFELFLSHIAPERLNAIYSTPNVKTDQTEPFYGTKFSVESLSQELIDQWIKAPIHSELALPEENEFIPTKLTILTSEEKTRPHRLIDNGWGTFWFQADDTFKLPKANVQLLLLTKASNGSPKEGALSLLYTMALSEGLNEWNYDIGLAGLHYSISRTDRGMQLDFSGYAENLPALMTSVAAKLKTITIDSNRFEILKKDLKRNIANAKLDVAYQQLLYELKYLSSKHFIHMDEIYDPKPGGHDLISPITLDELKQYSAERLYASIALEGAAYGSLDEVSLRRAIESYYQTLGSKVLPKPQRPEHETLQFDPGHPLAKIVTTEANNHCWGKNLQFGKRDPRLNAAIRVGHAHLKTSFFTELRTQQQLGYIVYSGLNHAEKVLGMLFLIQSSEYSPFEIARRVQKWKDQALAELASLSSEQLEAYKKAVATELRERDKTMAERHQTIIFETLILDGQFNYKERIAKEVEKLSKDDVLAVYRQAFDDKTAASLAVYMTKNKGLNEKPLESLISDDKQFKEVTPIF